MDTSKTKHTFSFQVDQAMADKVNDMVSHCLANGVKCSDGMVMRALISQTEIGPVLVGVVRARKEAEREERKQKTMANDRSDDSGKRPRAKARR